MKILVTGADGFLGSNVVRELLKRNHNVKAFIYPESKSTTLDGLDIERFKGNLLNTDDVIKAASDVDAVIHTAANTKTWPSRCKSHAAVNIEGTKNVIKAVTENNIKRMVYVGTANSFGPGTKENPGTEKNPYASAKYGLGYMDSKYQAHLLVLEAVKQGLPAVIVNPTFMFGPHDSGPSSGAMIVAVYKGKAPGYSPGGKNYVYVKDVAVGICNALTMGRIGESYILGNENLSYKEAFELIAQQIGAKTPKTRMPKFAVLAFGALSSGIASITGKAPAVSYPMARISCDGHYFSPAKAVKELQLPQTPVADAITEAFNWFKENNKL